METERFISPQWTLLYELLILFSSSLHKRYREPRRHRWIHSPSTKTSFSARKWSNFEPWGRAGRGSHSISHYGNWSRHTKNTENTEREVFQGIWQRTTRRLWACGSWTSRFTTNILSSFSLPLDVWSANENSPSWKISFASNPKSCWRQLSTAWRIGSGSSSHSTLVSNNPSSH